MVSGRDWEDALDSLPWEEGELLVVGSSRLGPVARVFLGSNSTKIMRGSPVPVLVVPRGADVHLDDTAPASGANKGSASAVLERCDLLENIGEVPGLLVEPYGSRAGGEVNGIIAIRCAWPTR